MSESNVERSQELGSSPQETKNTATVMVHWPGQSTAMCRMHADKARWLADGMGMPRATETPCDPQPCSNCVNAGGAR